ncbi:indole-3-glycerol phosphate synthase TrpC [Sulfurospirillum arcachonense]|uniref:indole-3-glycerol phosphate synthase TrpC n=1 Tax=Sulfurospirillum arcachonense TaxID=57666 RepID=UPI000467F382|nr:indole-3-glycerol phosphate synthase TrpC [Sulfurospirillum arcachonense]
MILDEIILKTKDDLEKRKKEFTMDWLGRSLAFNPYAPRDIKPYLTATKEDPYRIIAEVKKASPSKGIIKEDFDPLLIAKEYENGGASAISVLTEPHYFKGNIEYLTQIRRYVATPLLRKDFIVDEYQILEAVVYGADFVLLIAKALSKKELKALLEYTWRLGMEALVEIHDKEDLTKAIFAGANIIGVNHRNLDTFEMDMDLTEKLMPLIPNGKIIVAESGLNNKAVIEHLSKVGADAFLIGEHFMREENISESLKEIKKV